MGSGHGDAVGYIQQVHCGICTRHFLDDGKKENLLNRGWKRKWSWHKFRFIWLCPICSLGKPFERRMAMATCEEIKKAVKVVYPSSLHPGCFDLTPPVRVFARCSNIVAGAFMINPNNGNICVIQRLGTGYWVYPKFFEISEDQSQPVEIHKEILIELEELLHRVANEREEDDSGHGSMPTGNARRARDMLQALDGTAQVIFMVQFGTMPEIISTAFYLFKNTELVTTIVLTRSDGTNKIKE